jgi:hypothetical protein
MRTPTQHHELLSSAAEAPLHGPVRLESPEPENR